jgi:hypothetical protein
MIQSIIPVVYGSRNEKTGKIKIEVRKTESSRTDGEEFLVIDWALDNTDDAYYSKKVFWTNEQINQVNDYLESVNDFSGLSRVEIEKKKLQLALMLDTQTNLLASGKTIYGLTPGDWEFSE